MSSRKRFSLSRARASCFVSLILLSTCTLSWAQPDRQATEAILDGAQVYESACATCHGSDGRGKEASQVGFDTPLPDFTDCDFAAREPSSDWLAIIHDGGPTRGFDRLMPAFGEALSNAEIEDKFRDQAVLALPAGKVEALIEECWRIDSLADAGEIARMSRPE